MKNEPVVVEVAGGKILLMSDQYLDTVESFRFLGTFISQGLKWELNISCSMSFGLLRWLLTAMYNLLTSCTPPGHLGVQVRS